MQCFSVSNSFHNFLAIKVLLSKGADLQARDQDNWTPLIYAACRGHLPVVEVCITMRKAKLFVTKSSDSYWHVQTSRILIFPVCFHGKVLLSRGAAANSGTKTGSTALMKATKRNHLSIVEVGLHSKTWWRGFCRTPNPLNGCLCLRIPNSTAIYFWVIIETTWRR